MNGQASRIYVANMPTPNRQLSYRFALDTLLAQKVSGIRERIMVVGARLLGLPAYWPDFNPIELAFAKLKAPLGSAAERTFLDLREAIRQSLDCFAPQKRQAYRAAARYDAT